MESLSGLIHGFCVWREGKKWGEVGFLLGAFLVGRLGSSTMEAGAEEEKKKAPEGENKSKRKMKTAWQLEILEKTYAG